VLIYQLIGGIIGIIGIIISLLRFREGKMSLNMLLVWGAIWVLLILFSVYPTTTSILSNITGIGRGLDIILIFGLIGCFYLIFKIYGMIETIEEEITQLTREIALNSKDNLGEKSDDEP
jgi:hypothetical protein